MDQPLDVDFHEDFPPLPKSVKPSQSPVLKKISQAPVAVKEDLPLPEPAVSTPSESSVVVSRPPSPNGAQGATTPMHKSHTNNDGDCDANFLRSSVQGTPAIPRAPPPSSCELSTAGNTAPSTPTAAYVRPRMTVQSLHDHLLHANATLATLQEGRPLSMFRSTPTSPLLGPTIVFGDFGRSWTAEGGEGAAKSLDTTVGTDIASATEEKMGEVRTGASLIGS